MEQINPKNTYVIGFDIGGTKCSVVLGRIEENDNRICHIIERRRFLTREKHGYHEIIGELFSLTECLLLKHRLKPLDIRGIGISCGGPLDSSKGIVMNPPNLPGWDNVPIVKDVEERFGIKAHLVNDADACALAEWKFGAGKGTQNMVFLTFGTGMGAGLIINGKLYS